MSFVRLQDLLNTLPLMLASTAFNPIVPTIRSRLQWRRAVSHIDEIERTLSISLSTLPMDFQPCLRMKTPLPP